MPKPTASTKWATNAFALKLSVTSQQEQLGWTTSTGEVTGTPQKPILQYENGWRWAVNEWLVWLTSQAEASIPDQTGKSGLFLQSQTGVAVWGSPFPATTTNTLNKKFALIGNSVSSNPLLTDITWGYPWATPSALVQPNEFTFLRFDGTDFYFNSPFPPFATNGNRFLTLNPGGTALQWSVISGSSITSGTVGAAFLGLMTGATAGAPGSSGAVPFPSAGHQVRFLRGDATWQPVSEMPAPGAASTILQSNGTTASWGTLAASQIPVLDAGKVTTGVFATARIPVFTGATGGAAGSIGGVPQPAAGQQGSFLRADSTWVPTPIFGKLTLGGTGGAVDFSIYNVVDVTAISASATITFSNLTPGRIMVFVLATTSGTQTIAWPSGMLWADGNPLTAAIIQPATVTVISMGTAATQCYATTVRSFV